MNPTWAEENLHTIRTLMENSAIYRRALGPIMLAVGGVGLVASGVGLLRGIGSTSFIWYWLGVSAVAVIVALGLARREAIRTNEPFWSGPTRRVAQAMAVPLAAGAALTIPSLRDPALQAPVIGVWLALYGCALHSAGFFMPRGVRALGWVFVLAGVLVFVSLWSGDARVTRGLAHGVMGVCFGGFHLAYGLYLTATKRS